jgi:phage terminase large subunit-like protein
MGGAVTDRAAGEYLAIAAKYVDDVLSGRVPACKWVKAACQRQRDDLESAATDPHYPFRFDAYKAEHVCRFVELLPHIKGKWAGTLLVLEPWQVFGLTTIFGWLRHDGTRRFRTVYFEVPRKNAKSTLASGVALYMLTADNEPGAEVYSAATTREQAGIVFGVSASMTKRCAGLRERFGVSAWKHAVTVEHNDAVLAPLHAEGSTLDGLNVHCAVIDELHAHKTRAVYDVIETATGSRAQPLIFNITTSGSNRAGICYEQRTYLTQILNRTLAAHDGLGYPVKGAAAEDDTYWGIIYTLDDDDDWTDELSWAKANPNYGVSVYPDDIRRLAAKAIKLASARNNFLTKRLNVWVNAATAWMDMRAWDACADPDLSLDEMRGCDAIAALDLASKIDIADKVKVFLRDGHYYVFATHYLPESRLEEDDNSQFAGWAEDGWITTTPGNVTDFDVIEQGVRDDAAAHQLLEVAYDPFQATQLAGHLVDDGVTMVEVRQTVQHMSEAMKELESLVLQGRLHHNGDPVLSWMISNVVAHVDAKDNIYPRKESAGNKIDGAIALIMALARWIARRPEVSVYETRGLTIL